MSLSKIAKCVENLIEGHSDIKSTRFGKVVNIHVSYSYRDGIRNLTGDKENVNEMAMRTGMGTPISVVIEFENLKLSLSSAVGQETKVRIKINKSLIDSKTRYFIRTQKLEQVFLIDSIFDVIQSEQVLMYFVDYGKQLTAIYNELVNG